jgi:hypothetical protein
MAIKAKFLGREAVMKRLNKLVPDAETELAQAQLEVAQEAARLIAARAPEGDSGEYKRSIQGDRIANRPGQQRVVSTNETKDNNATGVFAEYLWRWLEFGTKKRVVEKTGKNAGKMIPRPHVMPTWRAYRKKARRKMATAVNKAVRRAKGK